MASPHDTGDTEQPALFDVPPPPRAADPEEPAAPQPEQPTLFDAAPEPAPELTRDNAADTRSAPSRDRASEVAQTAGDDAAEPAATAATVPHGAARREVGAAPSWTAGERAAFDLETTGRDPQEARIVTASVVLVDATGTVTREWEWLADPGIEIPAEAAAVHGVTTERARAEGRPAAEVTAQLHDVLSGLWRAGIPVLAFNAAYDLTVLARESERHGLPAPAPMPVLDPFVLNKQVHRYRRGKRTLGALCEEYGVVLDAAHTSAADALATERLATALVERFAELERPAEELHELQIGWAAEQAASLQEYFRRRDPEAVVDGTWPVHPRPWDRSHP